jgi:ribosomal protein L16/L10AE
MMLLLPKNVKFAKSYSRRKRLFRVQNIPNIVLGNFSLVSFENGKINNKQLEGVRRVLRRILKKQGKT